MMLLLKIAFRNILRNRRRSVMTGSAIAVGALAMLRVRRLHDLHLCRASRPISCSASAI